MIKGSCLCGTVSYEISDPGNLLHCHCSLCRKSHGSAYATFTSVKLDNLNWLEGQKQLGHFGVSVAFKRSFCTICGSTMPFKEGKYYSVPAGTLISPINSQVVGHIFVKSKAPWIEINDDLKHYDEFYPGEERKPVSISGNENGNSSGSCLCQTVRFSYNEIEPRMMNCHCDRCKRSRAAAHATNLFVSIKGFTLLAGEENIVRYALPNAKRFGTTFCKTCGSLLPRAVPELKRVNIPAGCLDIDPEATPLAHIHTASKANWFNITDDLPQFSESYLP